jgi:CTP:molybdopterin cytidylyltransferase MocA
MASSIRLGVGACRERAHEAAGLVLMGCDQPAVTAGHLRLLTGTGGLGASEYAGRRGIPAYLPARYWEVLENLQGDTGARELLHEAHAYQLADGEVDIDTPEDLEQILSKSARLHKFAIER